MRLHTLLLSSTLLAACAAPAEDDGGTWDTVDGKADGRALRYGELAATKTVPALDRVIAGLAVIDADVMPHEPKVVRKQLAELRDQVDIFVYAYATKNGDPWEDLRDELDEGYETIGAFKDLFDRQGVLDPAEAEYDDDEVADGRAQVIDWTADFLRAAHQAEVRTYLQRPSTSKLHDRDREDLSPYFWGATDLEPDATRSGLKNLARLTRELIDLALDDHDPALELRDLHRVENQELFHAFRKRVRSLVRLTAYFPEIVDPDDDVTEEITVLTEAVERYGAINDLLTRYFADPDGDLKDEIKVEWKALRAWQVDAELDDALDDLHDAIRH